MNAADKIAREYINKTQYSTTLQNKLIRNIHSIITNLKLNLLAKM